MKKNIVLVLLGMLILSNLQAQTIEYNVNPRKFISSQTVKLQLYEGKSLCSSNGEFEFYFTPDFFVFNYMDAKVIKDSLSYIHWDWRYTDITQEILGFLCHKAEAEFNGRRWIAWYADTLYGGPWKAFDLPGVVLQLYDSENFIKFTATKIDWDPVKFNIPNFENSIDYIHYIDWHNDIVRNTISNIDSFNTVYTVGNVTVRIESCKFDFIEPCILKK